MNEGVAQIFKENLIGSLATVNEDGSPLSTPIHLVSDGEFVYWFSSDQAVHSLNIERDSRVSVSLSSLDTRSGPKGVYIQGSAKRASSGEVDLVRDVFASRVGSFPKHFESASAFKLPIGQFDGDRSVGKCWYFHS